MKNKHSQFCASVGRAISSRAKIQKNKSNDPIYKSYGGNCKKKSLNRLNTKNWKCDFSLQPALKINKMLWWGG